MVSNFTFPHADINLHDIPVPQVADPTILPLHMPLFLSYAEKGPPNVPTIAGAAALQTKYGSNFLNERSPFFQHPNVFLKRALPFQQVMFVRLVDPAAAAASMVLTVTTTPGLLPQFQRNSDGSLILDVDGNPTPVLNNATPVSEPGITLTFAVRALAEGETLSTVATTTHVNGGATATTYPLLAFTSEVGSAGNLVGFRLFYSASFDVNAVVNMGAMTYSLQPVTLNSLTNIEQPIYDIFGSQTQTFAFKPNAFDPDTATYYTLTDVLTNDYQLGAANTLGPLPFQFHSYGSNVGLIGAAVKAVSSELGAIDPYLINILSAVDGNGNTYEHLVVDSTGPQLLNANVVDFLLGGTDGTMSKTALEALIVEYLNGTTYPQIGDTFRYPCTHFYDTGLTMASKQAIMAFYGIRDDIKIEFATQDVANIPNTAAQDQSAGSSIRASAILNPESLLFGTQACRASIYQQCGTLSDTQVYTTVVPATLDRMLKRCLYNNSDHVTGEPKGRPNSEVSIFNIGSLNWTPASPTQQQLSWSTGLNYIQFCDVNTLFYADLLSVYPIDTSLLSSDVFVDYMVYLKRIIRREWTIFVGRDDPPASLFKTIATVIDAACSFAFGGIITTRTVVSQTANDSALGFQMTVTTTVQGNMPNRVWKVIVPITRATP